MQRIFLVFAFWIFGACSKEHVPQTPMVTVDSIAGELEKNGVWAIEFFDTRHTLHMPIASIISCDGRPCEYKIPVIDSINDTALLGDPLEDSLVLYETKLREYSAEISARIPERGRVIVGIGVNEVGNSKDVLGVVLPILEKYSIRPETIEVKSLPQDSIRVSTHKGWRLIGDSVVFRHIVDVHIQRFVRK